MQTAVCRREQQLLDSLGDQAPVRDARIGASKQLYLLHRKFKSVNAKPLDQNFGRALHAKIDLESLRVFHVSAPLDPRGSAYRLGDRAASKGGVALPVRRTQFEAVRAVSIVAQFVADARAVGRDPHAEVR